jgi:hypothetical protein
MGRPGVCGYRSAEDVLSHLASHKLWHAEVLASILEGGPQVMAEARRAGDFNKRQVVLRNALPVREFLDAYHAAHLSLMDHAQRLTLEELTCNGSLP